MSYDRVPGVDSANRFPPEIYKALKTENNFIEAVDSVSRETISKELPKAVDSALIADSKNITGDFAWAVTDRDGYVALGVRTDGTVYPEASSSGSFSFQEYEASTKSSLKTIAVFGDSLSYGFFGGSANTETNKFSWPTLLSSQISATVSNKARSGWTVDAVAMMNGAYTPEFNVPSGVISGSSTTTLTSPGLGIVRGNVWTGKLSGISGNLTANSTTEFTFTPSSPTSNVNTSRAVFDAGFTHAADTVIIFLGRNDIYQNILGVEGNVSEHIFNGVNRIVDALTPQVKRYLVVSVTTGTGETRGNARYNSVIKANQMLAQKHGNHFVDLRKYLVEQAIYDLGLQPTSRDLSNMNGDTLPFSIMDPGAAGTGDGTHYSKETAALVSAYMKKQLESRGWA